MDAVTAVAGLRLLDGEELPLRPGQDAGDAGSGEPLAEALQVYGAAGYDRSDATVLAERWSEDVNVVMAFAGELLRDGELPPARPGGACEPRLRRRGAASRGRPHTSRRGTIRWRRSMLPASLLACAPGRKARPDV